MLTCGGLVEQDLVGKAEAPVRKVAVKVIWSEVDPHVAAVHTDGVQTRRVPRERSERPAEQILSWNEEYNDRDLNLWFKQRLFTFLKIWTIKIIAWALKQARLIVNAWSFRVFSHDNDNDV